MEYWTILLNNEKMKCQKVNTFFFKTSKKLTDFTDPVTEPLGSSLCVDHTINIEPDENSRACIATKLGLF